MRKNGELKEYEVVVRKEFSGVQIQNRRVQNTKFEAKQLDPFTNYTFSVKAIGSGGISESVTIRAQTDTSSEYDFVRFY